MKLNSSQKKQLVQAIQLAEKNTSGEIKVHLSYSKSELNILAAAQLKFEQEKMHLTHERNGVIFYINPTLRKFALYGDQGIHEKLGIEYWENLKNSVKDQIQSKDLITGITYGVIEIGNQLKTHFPYHSQDQNELSDDITESE